MANEPTAQESINWFKSTAERLTKNYQVLLNDPKNGVGGLTIDSIGRMYMFLYDPKNKDKLPVYDTFPLVLPINFYGNGFLGLNLHYLPRGGRSALLGALEETMTNDKYDDTTKLKISYNLLNKSYQSTGFSQCVKRYLYSHVGGRYVYIEPRNWNLAVNLPTERFVRNSNNIKGNR